MLRYLAIAALLPVLVACQSTPSDPGIVPGHTRDDAASDAVKSVFIAPTVLERGGGAGLTHNERQAVLREIDRQLCYEISERFAIAQVAAGNAIILTTVTRIQPTDREGSEVSAVANIFNPIPGVRFRAGSTGGLSVESELIGADGQPVANIIWSRDAGVVGSNSPSLSPVGDALQFAEPMADEVAAAFATRTRKSQKIGTPDPCARFGARDKITREMVVGAVTGLYVPEGEADEVFE